MRPNRGRDGTVGSERFPAITQHKTTVSTNSRDTAVSETEHLLPAVTPATLSTLSSGEFVGILAEDPDTAMELKAFHAKIRKKQVKKELMELPVVREIGPNEIEDNFKGVKAQVRALAESEMKRIMQYPKLKGVIGKG